MADLVVGRFDQAEEVHEQGDGRARAEFVDLNGKKVGRARMEPGWRWSVHGKPQAGTDSCEVEHIGYVVQGRLAVRMDDGTEVEIGPGAAYHVPPGHDAWVVGNEAVVHVDFSALVT